MENTVKMESTVCEFCLRVKGNENPTNWQRHITACKLKKEKMSQKKRKNDGGHGKITKFFKINSEQIGRISSVSVSDSYGSTVDVNEINIDVHDDVADTLGDDISIDVKKEDIRESTPIVCNIPSKCEGCKLNILDIFSNVACSHLKTIDIVIGNENLHHISCAEKSYAVFTVI